MEGMFFRNLRAQSPLHTRKLTFSEVGLNLDYCGPGHMFRDYMDRIDVGCEEWHNFGDEEFYAGRLKMNWQSVFSKSFGFNRIEPN